MLIRSKLFKGKGKKEHFQQLVEKMRQKLAGWKNKLLSTGGQIILIKHVLAAIPLYAFIVLQPPKSVLG